MTQDHITIQIQSRKRGYIYPPFQIFFGLPPKLIKAPIKQQIGSQRNIGKLRMTSHLSRQKKVADQTL